MPEIAFDPERDLFLARDVAASPEALWRGWTEPDLLKQWFCPKPWRVTDAEIDLRPGGIFRAAMAGPNGEVVDEGGGCRTRCRVHGAEPQRREVLEHHLHRHCRRSR